MSSVKGGGCGGKPEVGFSVRCAWQGICICTFVLFSAFVFARSDNWLSLLSYVFGFFFSHVLASWPLGVSVTCKALPELPLLSIILTSGLLLQAY